MNRHTHTEQLTMTPSFSVIIAQSNNERTDITELVHDRLISLSLCDERGFNADQLTIELDDSDGSLGIPPRNAKIHLAIGWKGQSLVDKGFYTIDEITHTGAPDKLTLRGRSADLRGSLSTKHERSFHDITLLDLIHQLAEENDLLPMCSQAYHETVIEHLDQTNESTINLLSRLAEEYDAIATVKAGYLLFTPTGTAETANGKPLPHMTITRRSGDGHNFSIAEGENYTAVRAYYHNVDNGKKGEVIIDQNTKIERQHRTTSTGKTSKQMENVLIQEEPVETDSEKMQTLRHTYKSEKAAINGAKAAFDKLQRGVAKFSLTLAEGNPELIPELPITVKGFKPQIDNTDWIITKITHSISISGFTSAVELEVRNN